MGSFSLYRMRGAQTLATGLSLSLALSTFGLADDPPQSRAAAPRRLVADQIATTPVSSPPGRKSPRKLPIRRVAVDEAEQPGGTDNQRQSAAAADPGESARLDERSVPIDLAAALRLAGVENLEMIQARQRVEMAVAQQQLTAAQILPTLNLGTNYDSHTGNLQQSSGNILNLQRSALYVGAGANAVAAGTVSIPGLQWNLNLSESIYNYLSARKRNEQSRFANQAVENEVLLKVAVAYTDLLQARAVFSLAVLTRNDAREVARLTANYAITGDGRQSDADRAATELRRREEEVIGATAEVGQASRHLAELLNLSITTPLRPVESQVVPQSIVPNRIPLSELIAVALLDRSSVSARGRRRSKQPCSN